MVWPQSVLLRISNSKSKPVLAAVTLDLDGLGIKAEKPRRDFTSIVALDDAGRTERRRGCEAQ